MAEEQATQPSTHKPVRIVFDGPPSHEAPRFVEVEDADGAGQRVGEWKPYKEGFWTLGFFVEAEYHKAALALAEHYIPTDELEAYITARRAATEAAP